MAYCPLSMKPVAPFQSNKKCEGCTLRMVVTICCQSLPPMGLVISPNMVLKLEASAVVVVVVGAAIVAGAATTPAANTKSVSKRDKERRNAVPSRPDHICELTS